MTVSAAAISIGSRRWRTGCRWRWWPDCWGYPDGDSQTLLSWTFAATQLRDGVVGSEQVTAATAAAVEMAGYLSQRLDLAMDRPGPDLLGDLARACHAGTVPYGTAVLMSVQLVAAGGESTASLLGTAARRLATRPELAAMLRTEPDLIPVLVEEVLRLESPFRGPLPACGGRHHSRRGRAARGITPVSAVGAGQSRSRGLAIWCAAFPASISLWPDRRPKARPAPPGPGLGRAAWGRRVRCGSWSRCIHRRPGRPMHR